MPAAKLDIRPSTNLQYHGPQPDGTERTLVTAGTGEGSGATGTSFFSRTSWLSSWVWWTTS